MRGATGTRADPPLRRAGLAIALVAGALLAGCGSGGASGTDAAGAAPTAAATGTTPSGTTPLDTAQTAAPGAADAAAVVAAPSAVASTQGVAGGVLTAGASTKGCEPALPGTTPMRYDGGVLHAACRDLWLDAGYGSAEEAAVVTAVDRAARRIAEVFGRAIDGLPIVVMCRTAACVRHYTGDDGRNITLYPGARAPGGAFAAAARTVTIVTAPTLTWLEEILAHEFSHHELYGRLGGRLERIPPWFNEGLATLVGHVPSCAPMPASPVPPASLADQSQWNLYTAVHPEIALAVYCAAARELDAWIVAHGRSELLRLIDDVAAGVAFTERYGPMYLDRAPMRLSQAL